MWTAKELKSKYQTSKKPVQNAKPEVAMKITKRKGVNMAETITSLATHLP